MEGAPPLSWIAHPVRVQLVPGGSEQCVEGNLSTLWIHLNWEACVLVRFRNEKPCQVSWIPREGYTSVSMIDESSPHCQQYSVELADMMGNMLWQWRQPPRLHTRWTPEELKKGTSFRRTRLLSWLRANHVDVKECDDGSLLIFARAAAYSSRRSTEDQLLLEILIF
ncbi:hypothetical protein COOONC_01999 [Cooperia oncophora]